MKKFWRVTIVVMIIIMAITIGLVLKIKAKSNNILNSNSTKQYISEEGDIPNKNDIEIPTDNLETNSNKENVTIEVLQDTITKETAEIIITDNNEEQYGWGVDFRVQKKVNRKWEELERTGDDLLSIEIAYEFDENNQIHTKVNYGKYYGTLEKGTYRIVKTVYDNGYIDFYSNEFDID